VLLKTVKDAPDLYLDELREELKLATGVSASIPTVWRTLRRVGYTMKKVCNVVLNPFAFNLLRYTTQLTRVALERSVETRREFAARIGTYELEKLVFVDESAVDHHVTY
jgi:hypothetical protein